MSTTTEDDDGTQLECSIPAMSLRDYFAAQAITSATDCIGSWSDEGVTKIARLAYKIADAMLAARGTGDDRG